ncbi:MAG: PAS domain-containing sensor histidine kinase, partial [Proteobacteria bacterium]|nr:PAS domain-containing sensor histidine kinase [Pseudomonadota bacterium]
MLESPRALRETPELSWRVLGLMNVFRLLVPAVLALVFALGGQPHLVGEAHPDLFRGACLTYFIAALALVAVLKRRRETTARHAYLPAILDVAALSLIVYASGGAESGLAIALLVPVGAISVIVDTRGALVMAATAALALLALQLVAYAQGGAAPMGFAQAGYYGAMLFLAAGGGTSMARRLRETEAVVRQRDIDVANLAELSEYIVQHLRESIVVVDAADRVRLINESARQLLGPEARPGALLGEISPRLLYHVESWRRSGGASITDATLIAADGAAEFQAHFAALGRDQPGPVIVFLTDSSALAERVQQTKLAALGRLSASIAHEIRNPVGAMSHAAQLLGETAALGPEERRLTEIMTQNAERVSTIIANVLQLSRRESTRPERIAIGEWLGHFREEFLATLQLPEGQLRVRLPEPDFEVRVDPTHLRQIVWNLCENATRHSADVPGNPP